MFGSNEPGPDDIEFKQPLGRLPPRSRALTPNGVTCQREPRRWCHSKKPEKLLRPSFSVMSGCQAGASC